MKPDANLSKEERLNQKIIDALRASGRPMRVGQIWDILFSIRDKKMNLGTSQTTTRLKKLVAAKVIVSEYYRGSLDSDSYGGGAYRYSLPEGY